MQGFGNVEDNMTRKEQLNYLIKELSPSMRVPASFDAQWRVFRSLVNRREPMPVSAQFLSVQDDLLRSLIAEKGVTVFADLRPLENGIYLWRGDITTLKVDAIVNAANSGMLGCFAPCHACIDNAIHTFAGVQLRLECAELMRAQGYPEPTGQAKITDAYNLPSRFVLHTVGPIVGGALTDEHRAQLASCYRACLELASANGLASIAFCCISTGEFRFPNRAAAEIAVSTVRDYLKAHDINVVFNVFKEEDFSIYEKLLGRD